MKWVISQSNAASWEEVEMVQFYGMKCLSVYLDGCDDGGEEGNEIKDKVMLHSGRCNRRGENDASVGYKVFEFVFVYI